MSKKWIQNGENYELHFDYCGDNRLLGRLYRDPDEGEHGDWCFLPEIDGVHRGVIASGRVGLHDAKLEVEERITTHFEVERDYYQAMLDEFIG